MDRAQVHFEVFARRAGSSAWVLELATEDRARATEAADEMLAEHRALAVRITKETLDEETREYHSVTILTKGAPDTARPKRIREGIEPICAGAQDLYTPHSREQIGRLLDGWLGRFQATPFELLHRPDLAERLDATGVELQHAIQKIAIPEAQARGGSVHELIRAFQKLAQQATARLLKDARLGVLPNFHKETFAAAAERLMGDPDRAYLLGTGVAAAMADAQGWAAKVGRLLDLADAAPQSPAAGALAFQVIGQPLAEILGSKAGAADLFGEGLDLGARLAAMTRLVAGEAVEMLAEHEPSVAKVMPPLHGPAARLAEWLANPHFEDVRAALAHRLLKDLMGPRRLRPADAEAEIEILRALAMALTASAGKVLPVEEIQHAFSERSRMLVRSDFIEAYLGNRTALGEADALVWLAENVTGAANKRQAGRWISANLLALRFETDIRNGPDSPAAKLAGLAALQKTIKRIGLAPEETEPLCARIGEVGGLVEADARLTAAIGHASAPAVHRLTLLLKLATGEAAPLGPAADRAKAEALKLVRQPAVRAELVDSPETVERVKALMQTSGIAA